MFNTVRDGCDTLFGAGMGNKICGERPNLRVALTVFEKIRDSEDKQADDMKKLSNSVIKKYEKKK